MPFTYFNSINNKHAYYVKNYRNCVRNFRKSDSLARIQRDVRSNNKNFLYFNNNYVDDDYNIFASSYPLKCDNEYISLKNNLKNKNLNSVKRLKNCIKNSDNDSGQFFEFNRYRGRRVVPDPVIDPRNGPRPTDCVKTLNMFNKQNKYRNDFYFVDNKHKIKFIFMIMIIYIITIIVECIKEKIN